MTRRHPLEGPADLGRDMAVRMAVMVFARALLTTALLSLLIVIVPHLADRSRHVARLSKEVLISLVNSATLRRWNRRIAIVMGRKSHLA